MEAIDVVIVEPCDLLSSDVLRGRDEMRHLREIAADDIKGVILVARVVLKVGRFMKSIEIMDQGRWAIGRGLASPYPAVGVRLAT